MRRRPSKKNLFEVYALQARPDSDTFWSRFRSRAASAPQEQPLRWCWPAPYPVMARWAAACSIVLMLGVFSYVNLRPVAGSYHAVQALDVVGPYESVLILSDTEDQATIVWVNGL